MQRDFYTYYEKSLVKYFCQMRGKTRHGDSALFNRDQYIIHRYHWIDGRGYLAESSDGMNVTSLTGYNGRLKHGWELHYHDYNKDLIKSRHSYRDGMLHGAYALYNQSGDEIEIGMYENNKLHGDRIIFFDRDPEEIKIREQYHRGLLHGRQIEYSIYGDVIRDREFVMGVPVNVNNYTLPVIGLAAMALPAIKKEDSQVCPVCMNTEPELQMPCGHQFCKSCMQQWDFAVCELKCPFPGQPYEVQCPLCRHVI